MERVKATQAWNRPYCILSIELIQLAMEALADEYIKKYIACKKILVCELVPV